MLLSTCRILHIHHNAAVFTEIEKKRNCCLLCFFVLRKNKCKEKRESEFNERSVLDFYFSTR